MPVDIVFDGPPGPRGGRFIEVEDTETGESIRCGEWVSRDDGYWALRITDDDVKDITLGDYLAGFIATILVLLLAALIVIALGGVLQRVWQWAVG